MEGQVKTNKGQVLILAQELRLVLEPQIQAGRRPVGGGVEVVTGELDACSGGLEWAQVRVEAGAIPVRSLVQQVPCARVLTLGGVDLGPHDRPPMLVFGDETAFGHCRGFRQVLLGVGQVVDAQSKFSELRVQVGGCSRVRVSMRGRDAQRLFAYGSSLRRPAGGDPHVGQDDGRVERVDVVAGGA